MSTVPSPAGLRDDRGSIVEGPWERSDLSATKLKKFHSHRTNVNLSSSAFSITLYPPPRAVTRVMHNIVSSVLPNGLEARERRTFFPCENVDLESPLYNPTWGTEG